MDIEDRIRALERQNGFFRLTGFLLLIVVGFGFAFADNDESGATDDKPPESKRSVPYDGRITAGTVSADILEARKKLFIPGSLNVGRIEAREVVIKDEAAKTIARLGMGKEGPSLELYDNEKPLIELSINKLLAQIVMRDGREENHSRTLTLWQYKADDSKEASASVLNLHSNNVLHPQALYLRVDKHGSSIKFRNKLSQYPLTLSSE